MRGVKKMEKICIAFDLSDFEVHLKKRLGTKDYSYTTSASYVDEVPDIVLREDPDILLLSSSLEGSGKSGIGMTFMDMVEKVRRTSSCRIIIVAVGYKVGSSFYKKLIGLGIYDIAVGEDEVSLKDIVEIIKTKREYKDIAYLLGEKEENSDITVKPNSEVRIAVNSETKKKKGFFNRGSSKNNEPKPEEKISVKEPVLAKEPVKETDSFIDRVPDIPLVSDDIAYSDSYNNVDQNTSENNEYEDNGTSVLMPQSTPANYTCSEYNNRPGLVFHLCSVEEINSIYNTENEYNPLQVQSQTVANGYNSAVEVQGITQQQSFQTDLQEYNGANQSQIIEQEPYKLDLQDSFHRESDVLIGDNMPASMMFLKKRQLAKKIVFTGLIDGVGTTTNAINTAFCLAVRNPDKRVLLVNGIPSDIALYEKLNLPTDGYTLDQIAENIANGTIKSNCCLDKKKLMYGANNNEDLFSTIPDNLEFIRVSRGLYENGDMEHLNNAIEQLAVAYDYIVFDSKFGYSTSYEKMLSMLADIVFLSVIQDFSVLKKTENYLSQTGMRGKSALIINRYVSSSIDTRYISNALNINDIYTVSSDVPGFVAAASEFGCYYQRGKRKVRKEINWIADRIMGED